MAEYQFETEEEKAKSSSSHLRYFLYIGLILIATGLSLSVSLIFGNFEEILATFKAADWRYVLIVFGLVIASFLVEGLTYLVFCRLYTRHYKWHQGVACSLVGEFYNDITPGSTSGRIMSAYTLKSQGIPFSNAASIMVMWFILNQSAIILYGAVSLAFEWRFFTSLQPTISAFGVTITPPMWPLIILGFVIDISFIALLLLMSYSRAFHHFFLEKVIGFLGKIHLLRHPEQTKESLRIQVENFKMELRRLQSNIPVLLLLLFLFLLKLFLRYSLPYFCGMAMHAYGENASFVFASWDGEVPSLLRSTGLMAFHQMVTSIIPLPGSAGVSELFYSLIFEPFYGSGAATTAACQILWRSASYYLVLLFTGIFTAFYKSRGLPTSGLTRKTYVTLQLETYEERRASFDEAYATKDYRRSRLKKAAKRKGDAPSFRTTRTHLETREEAPISQKEAKKKAKAEARRRKKEKEAWDDWTI